nr:hypothetical protein [Pararhizobium sp. IMCC3301]
METTRPSSDVLRDVEQFCTLLRLHIDNTGNDYLKWMTSQKEEAAEIS